MRNPCGGGIGGGGDDAAVSSTSSAGNSRGTSIIDIRGGVAPVIAVNAVEEEPVNAVNADPSPGCRDDEQLRKLSLSL